MAYSTIFRIFAEKSAKLLRLGKKRMISFVSLSAFRNSDDFWLIIIILRYRFGFVKPKKKTAQWQSFYWGVEDSNLWRRESRDLQSLAIAAMRTPQKAACRIWTHDPEITNHVLYQLS